MTKLTELEKQKVITCVSYVAGKYQCDHYKFEIAYDKVGHYDKDLEEQIEHARYLEEFYFDLARKLEEVL